MCWSWSLRPARQKHHKPHHNPSDHRRHEPLLWRGSRGHLEAIRHHKTARPTHTRRVWTSQDLEISGRPQLVFGRGSQRHSSKGRTGITATSAWSTLRTLDQQKTVRSTQQDYDNINRKTQAWQQEPKEASLPLRQFARHQSQARLSFRWACCRLQFSPYQWIRWPLKLWLPDRLLQLLPERKATIPACARWSREGKSCALCPVLPQWHPSAEVTFLRPLGLWVWQHVQEKCEQMRWAQSQVLFQSALWL